MASGTSQDTRPVDASNAGAVSRRQYWVVPRLQARFTGWLIAISTVIATTVTLGVLLIVWSSLVNQMLAEGVEVDASQLFWDACMRVFVTTGFLMVIFGFVTFLVGVIVSHRVAGPLYRLGQVAREAVNGRYDQKVELRESDYLHEFAGQFSAMLDSFNERVKGHQRVLSGLHNRLADLEEAVADGRTLPGEIETKLQDALATIREARMTELSEDVSEAQVAASSVS